MEIGALTVMTIGFRERELVLDLFELITGLRMNHAFIRPGGVAQDLPPGALDQIRDFIALMKKRLPEYADALQRQPDLQGPARRRRPPRPRRLPGARPHRPGAALDRLPVGPAQDRSPTPATRTTTSRCRPGTPADSYGRFRIRLDEMWESLRIVEQAAERLAGLEGAPVMVADKKIAWPSQLAVGTDGMGNSLDHIRHIMGESMEALIHHFKLVTEGFRVPAGQAYVPIESPRGELGAHVVSDGGTRPFRAHFRDPSFTNLQATAVMSEGGMVADVIVAIASHRPRDGRSGPVTDRPAQDGAATAAPSTPSTLAELREIAARYPQARSGAAADAAPRAERRGPGHLARHRGLRRHPRHHRRRGVSGVATFYTMYKRRPVGDYHVGVCTNTLCAVMGGDADLRAAQGPPRRRQRRDHRRRQDHPRARRVQRGLRLRPGDDGQLGVHGQPDARVGDPAGRRPARGHGGPLHPRPARSAPGARPSGCSPASPTTCADEGPAAGPASLVGLQIARENGWTAPGSDRDAVTAGAAEGHAQGPRRADHDGPRRSPRPRSRSPGAETVGEDAGGKQNPKGGS